MKIHLPRLCAALALSLGLAWFLPVQYARLTASERFSLSGAYSALTREFVLMEYGSSAMTLRRENGEKLANREGQMLLPFLFTNSVRKWGGFPVRLEGRAISYEEARRMKRAESLSPRRWNGRAIPLYRLVESSPEEAEMAWPPDVFRVEERGLTFMRCEDGGVDEEKSRVFTEALNRAGTRWPLTAVGFNEDSPPAYRPFDMGHVLADAGGRLFRLQMARGRPVCEALNLTVPGRIRKIMVRESEARDYYALIVCDAAVYMLRHDNSLLPLPLPRYDADSDSLSLRGDPLNFSFEQQSLPREPGDLTRLLATDREGLITRHRDFPLPEAVRERLQRTEDAASLLFPVVLRQYLPVTSETGLRPGFREPLKRHLALALAGGLFWSAALYCIRRGSGRRKRQKAGGAALAEYLFTLCGGLPGLAGVLLLGPLARPGRGEA